ncbi:type III secretion system inner membrane ring lipoprotein SctJ [Marivita sp. GX14005]|uniref:type III secretion system inner membrane ring lipoprotein SctJ n=1 Tax=Marivita sp. GX14005 TaxID=2942276 RepID=UPI0020189BC0|nr:type III secretion inner membrane ring lipoprotein SctJ [Marivita sp. GX14005]MCL3883303.1 type III secretion inner membrane ring lipoprotein SctJ [Marivita sp. GX14005]
MSLVLTPVKRASRALAMLGLVLFLAACQTDLYSGLTEREANEMLAALLGDGIDAQKVAAGDGLFSVSVPDGQVRGALSILDAQGLPRGSRQSLGKVFAKSGIVSSPFEERIRFVYALSEEVSSTLEQIDGVTVARVHIVMPEDPALGQDVKPSSAAVFIKQKPGYDLDFLMPQVRRLVANAIEGVSYDAVTVVLVEAQPVVVADRPAGPELAELMPGVRVEASAVSQMRMLGIGAATIIALLAGAVGFLAWRVMKPRASVPAEDEGADLV